MILQIGHIKNQVVFIVGEQKTFSHKSLTEVINLVSSNLKDWKTNTVPMHIMMQNKKSCIFLSFGTRTICQFYFANSATVTIDIDNKFAQRWFHRARYNKHYNVSRNKHGVQVDIMENRPNYQVAGFTNPNAKQFFNTTSICA